MTYEYPLSWPVGVPRAERQQHSRFDTPESVAKHNLEAQLRLMNAQDVVVTTNVELRRDGRPYANQRVSDVGVSVYFRRKGRDQVIACDKWNSIRDNLVAVGKTIEALRGIERWGTGEMVDAAFTGFTALPAQAGASPVLPDQQAWYQVLGVSSTASPEVIEAAYRLKRKSAHPDMGGSDDEFREVQRAYEESKR